MGCDYEVYAPGSAVEIGPEDHPIRGTVCEVHISRKGVEYLVAWWDGRSRTLDALQANEVRWHPEAKRMRQVGFMGGG